MAAAAEKLEIGLLGSFAGDSAVKGALEQSNVVGVDMADAAKNASAVGMEGGNLNFHGGNGVVTPGQHGGLGGLVGGPGTGVGGGSGNGGAVPAGPKGTVENGPLVSSSKMPSAERVISGLKGKFRVCYNQGLAQNPEMGGSVTMVTKIAPNGEVASVDPSNLVGLSDSVVNCIKRALKNADGFDKTDTGATLQLPFKFVKGQ